MEAIYNDSKGFAPLSQTTSGHGLRSTAGSRPKAVKLSHMQLGVLVHGSYGRSTSETAAALFVARDTVRVHRLRLFNKLAVNGMVAAVRKGFELGFLPEINNSQSTYGDTVPVLTDTELLELDLASRGFSATEAAQERLVATVTTKTHRGKILRKLEVNSMVHAVRVACELNMIPLFTPTQAERSHIHDI